MSRVSFSPLALSAARSSPKRRLALRPPSSPGSSRPGARRSAGSSTCATRDRRRRTSCARAASGVSAARNASAALRTGSVETPVERIGKSPGTTLPSVVMPRNGSARPRASKSFDLWRKRASRSAAEGCCESARAPAKAQRARSTAREATSDLFVIRSAIVSPQPPRDPQRVAAAPRTRTGSVPSPPRRRRPRRPGGLASPRAPSPPPARLPSRPPVSPRASGPCRACWAAPWP